MTSTSRSHNRHQRCQMSVWLHRQRESGSRRTRVKPASAHQHRGDGRIKKHSFDAPEVWHEPPEDSGPVSLTDDLHIKFVRQPAGQGYLHPVSADDVRERILELPAEYRQRLHVVQFSRMTRKRRLFPCYGLQWGTAVYLYPIEETLEEIYVRAPRPAQRIETEMYGGRWTTDGTVWRLTWTMNTIRDFYLNNVLIHEIGHINDNRNTSFRKREQFADWFAMEFGYRHSRGRRV